MKNFSLSPPDVNLLPKRANIANRKSALQNRSVGRANRANTKIIMKRFIAIALVTAAISACARAGDDGAVAAPNIVADAATANASAFDGGKIVPRAFKRTAPTYLRKMLPRGAKTMFCQGTKLGKTDVLIHGWNPAKGDGRIDILVPVETKASPKSKKYPVYARLNGVTVERIESQQYRIQLAPLKAGKPGWVMAASWSQSQAAGAFMTVPMKVFIAPGGNESKVITQDTSTESSVGGNEFYDLRIGKNGDAFLMMTSESFDAGTKRLQSYRWNGTEFVRSGESAELPLILGANS